MRRQRGRLEVVPPHSHLVSVMILLEEHFQRLGQLHVVHVAVVDQLVADGGPAEDLEGEGVLPVDWMTEHWLEEHTGGGVFVVVQQLRDVPRHEDAGVVAVEAEPVSLLLYPGVETPAVPSEADTEQILVLS